MNPTFASFLEPQGIIVAAGIITTLIQLLKTALPVFDARVSGALASFIFSLLLYAFVAIVTKANEADALLLVFVSWLTCATAAVGTYATIKHASGAE